MFKIYFQNSTKALKKFVSSLQISESDIQETFEESKLVAT